MIEIAGLVIEIVEARIEEDMLLTLVGIRGSDPGPYR